MANLLVVDDEIVSLQIIEDYLSGEDYWITTVADGNEAWITLDEDPDSFDGVIMDRMMPGMSGMELLQRIHADQRFVNLPVIMQTSASNAEEVGQGLMAGAWYYLSKPFSKDALISVLRIALEERAHRLELVRLSNEINDVLGLIEHATFRFKRLGEIRELAASLSKICCNSSNVAMGLSELMINAVEHGNLEIGYDKKAELVGLGCWQQEVEKRLAEPVFRNRCARIEFVHKGDIIQFTIRDGGHGFDWRPYLNMDEKRVLHNHGRGIALARELAFPDLTYLGCGNIVTMTTKALEVPVID